MSDPTGDIRKLLTTLSKNTSIVMSNPLYSQEIHIVRIRELERQVNH